MRLGASVTHNMQDGLTQDIIPARSQHPLEEREAFSRVGGTDEQHRKRSVLLAPCRGCKRLHVQTQGYANGRDIRKGVAASQAGVLRIAYQQIGTCQPRSEFLEVALPNYARSLIANVNHGRPHRRFPVGQCNAL